MLDSKFSKWLKPSKGVHFVFDLKRLNVPGCVVMNNPADGRIAFVIPRRDMGDGVVIVGTTDGPSPEDPAQVGIDPNDKNYILDLLNRYFPDHRLTADDILSAYVGVRPLFSPQGVGASLQKVSREHHIDFGPGRSVMVAGGKYTTHREMAKEIVDFAIKAWRHDAAKGLRNAYPAGKVHSPDLSIPINPAVEPVCSLNEPSKPDRLLDRYGAEADRVREYDALYADVDLPADPAGFPALKGQLVHAIRNGMVLNLADFYHRRVGLFLTRKDHGKPWARGLAQILLREQGVSATSADFGARVDAQVQSVGLDSPV